MSRGLGRLQRIILAKLEDSAKLMTFEQIMGPLPDHGCGFHPYLIRSVRRALRKLIDDEYVLAAGVGGPRSPHRYFIHPIRLAYSEIDTYLAALGPEAKEAFDDAGRQLSRRMLKRMSQALEGLEAE